MSVQGITTAVIYNRKYREFIYFMTCRSRAMALDADLIAILYKLVESLSLSTFLINHGTAFRV